jgi:hypothetical protein
MSTDKTQHPKVNEDGKILLDAIVNDHRPSRGHEGEGGSPNMKMQSLVLDWLYKPTTCEDWLIRVLQLQTGAVKKSVGFQCFASARQCEQWVGPFHDSIWLGSLGAIILAALRQDGMRVFAPALGWWRCWAALALAGRAADGTVWLPGTRMEDNGPQSGITDRCLALIRGEVQSHPTPKDATQIGPWCLSEVKRLRPDSFADLALWTRDDIAKRWPPLANPMTVEVHESGHIARCASAYGMGPIGSGGRGVVEVGVAGGKNYPHYWQVVDGTIKGSNREDVLATMGETLYTLEVQ